MTSSKLVLIVCAAVVSSAFVLPAQAPVVDVEYHKHLKLWRAQRDMLSAFENIEQAQSEAHDRLGSHAVNARKLLFEAANEVALAAREADKR
jgi:hypothetical protein